MLRAVFFDAVGTLIYLPRSVGEHYRDLALQFGADMEAVRLDHAFRTAWGSSPAKLSIHHLRPDDDKEWWRNLVNRVLAQVLPATQREEFDAPGYFEALYTHFAKPGVWEAYPEATAVLAALHARGLSLAVVSNFDRRLYAVLEHLRLSSFFAHIVISSEVGADKPDPFIFQRALEMMRVDPAEVVHVGDDPRCDWGASAVGMHVYRLKRPALDLNHLINLIDAHAAL